MNATESSQALLFWGAIGTILAGAIHILIVPVHWAHAPAHGLFFLLVGILQIAAGIAVWRKPTNELYYVGSLTAGWLIVLYVITRLFPAPFGHGAESISAIDLLCKFSEAVGMLTLGALIFQGLLARANSRAAWQALLLIVFASVIAGFATYGIARAAEPFFPTLSVPVHEHQHDSSAVQDGHHHETAPADAEDH